VTTSSIEAELLAISSAAKEVIWWRRFFAAISFNTQQECRINCDNLQTICILTKAASKLDTRLRHVNIHQHWLRQEVQSRKIALRWLPTAEMPADGFTKAMAAQKQAAFVQQLNLVDISERLRHTVKEKEYKDGEENGAEKLPVWAILKGLYQAQPAPASLGGGVKHQQGPLLLFFYLLSQIALFRHIPAPCNYI
jgi:hypothetical protein